MDHFPECPARVIVLLHLLPHCFLRLYKSKCVSRAEQTGFADKLQELDFTQGLDAHSV
jgi:hypothetical protein